MENTKVEEKKNNKVIFGLKIFGNVVFYAILICLMIFSIMNIRAGSKNGGFPNIFGKGFLSVQTRSMTREENSTMPSEYNDYKIGEIKAGDLVYVNVVKQKDIANLKEGDVITFYDSGLKALNTHRIVNISKDENGNVSNISVQGDYSVSLYGKYDPNNPDKAQNNMNLIGKGDVQILSPSTDEIKGVVTGVSSGTGKVIDNIQKNWLWYFVLPVLVFLLIEIFMVVKNIMDLKGAKQKADLESNKEVMMADLEAQKEEMRKQILAELKAQQEALNNENKVETKEEVLDTKVENKAETKEEALDEAMVSESGVLETAQPVEEKETEEEINTEVVTDNVEVALDTKDEVIEETPSIEEKQTEAPKVEEVVEKKAAPKKATAKKTTGTTKKTTSTKSTTSKSASKKTTTKSTSTKSNAQKKSTTTKKTTTKSETKESKEE